MRDYPDLTPVNIVTGFLGSGKTTLLQRLLSSPKMARTAVLINEFGEVGLDHLLVRQIDAATVLLQSGCICCNIREDLNVALRSLLSKRERKEIPAFDRVVIETTGLADPAPIIYTLFAEPVLRYHFRLGNVITTVDAVNAERHLTRNPEGVNQVALADHLVITKTDIAESEAADTARQMLARLNPSARRFDACSDPIDAGILLACDLYDPATKSAAVRGWFKNEAQHGGMNSNDRHEHGRGRHSTRHDSEISSFSLTFDGTLDWTVFGIWLSMLLHRHGENVLRVKGILNAAGETTPVVINGVQHLVHPPLHLDRWPSADRRSHIIFITRGMDPAQLRRSLAAFNRLVPAAVAA